MSSNNQDRTAQDKEESFSLDALIKDESIVSSLRERNLTTLNRMQSLIIPQIINKNDLLVKGSLQPINLGLFHVVIASNSLKDRVLVVAESDDLIDKLVNKAMHYKIPVAKITGGARNRPQHLQNAVLIVGTTRSLLEAFDQGTLDGSRIGRLFLLDCAQSITNGTLEELMHLLHDLEKTQIIFSAGDTVSPAIFNFIKKFLKTPASIEISHEQTSMTTEDNGSAATTQADQRKTESGHSSESEKPVRQPTPTDRAPAQENRAKLALADIEIAGSTLEHLYIELPAELLAKPNILGDLIESSGVPTVVVCNSPSDADLTEVMLRKRGINARKLIGFVPYGKLQSAFAAFASGEASTLVVTDISARDVCLPNIGMIIQHSVPAEVAIYQSRAAMCGGIKLQDGQVVRRCITLLTPLDLASFHTITKGLPVTLTKSDAPKKENVLAAKVTKLSQLAMGTPLANDPRFKTIQELIEKDVNKDKIMALLISNTLDVLPSLQSFKSRTISATEDRPFREEEGNSRQERSSRGRRRDYQENNYEDTQSTESPSRAYVPPVRDIRFYMGHGTNDGVSPENLKDLVLAKTGLPKENFKRSIVRPLFSFFDLPEQVADKALESLSKSEFKEGVPLFVRKAVTISNPREAQDNNPSTSQQDNSSSNMPNNDFSEQVTVQGDMK